MQIINQIQTWPDKNAGRITTKNGKTMYVCRACGRLSFRKIQSQHAYWCHKHYMQIRKYRHVLDNNPRTITDRNEIRIDGATATMGLYDKHSVKIAETTFDAEDVPLVRFIKWKLSASGYVMNAPKFKSSNQHMSRLIMHTDQFVDHINHNTLDNRKQNLRIVTKSQNAMNTNSKGVTVRKDNRFYAHIKIHQKMLNLGIYVDKEEALYARWYAEQLLFKPYNYPKPEPELPRDRKVQIQTYVNQKVQRL